MNTRKILTLVLVVITIAGAVFAAIDARNMLPAKNSVKGFTVMAGSFQYGKGDDLTEIYDGGYELYTKAGVIDAARQMYQRKSDYVEVTVHTMKSSKAALDFLRYWQKENKVKSLTKGKHSTSFTITKPNAAAYMVTGTYFTTISAFYTTDKAKNDLAAFQGVIEKKIASRSGK